MDNCKFFLNPSWNVIQPGPNTWTHLEQLHHVELSLSLTRQWSFYPFRLDIIFLHRKDRSKIRFSEVPLSLYHPSAIYHQFQIADTSPFSSLSSYNHNLKYPKSSLAIVASFYSLEILFSSCYYRPKPPPYICITLTLPFPSLFLETDFSMSKKLQLELDDIYLRAH